MKSLKYILFFLFLYGLYCYEASRMFIVETSVKSSMIYPVCLLLVFILTIVLSKGKTNTHKISLFASTIYILMLFHSFSHPLNAKLTYITLLLPVIVVFFPQKILNNGVTRFSFDHGLLIVFLLLVVFYFYNYQNNLLINVDNQNNAAYTLLFFSPVLICSKYKYIRYIVLISTGLALMYSLKRSGIAAFVLAFVAYLLVTFFIVKGFKSKMLFMLIISIGLYACFDFFQANWGDRDYLLIERFTQLDDGGSGRDDIYKTTYSMITNSDIDDLLLGHGYDSVSRYSPLKCSAHNDYLEYIYDYGVIGFLLLLSFIISFYKYVVSLIKDRSQYSPPAIYTLVLVFINSFFSHVFFYEWYFLLIALFWSYINWASNEDKKNELMQ